MLTVEEYFLSKTVPVVSFKSVYVVSSKVCMSSFQKLCAAAVLY